MFEDVIKKIHNIDFVKIEGFISMFIENYILKSSQYDQNQEIETSHIDYTVLYHDYDFIEWIITKENTLFPIELKLVINDQNYSELISVALNDLKKKLPEVIQNIEQITLEEFSFVEEIKSKVLNKSKELIEKYYKPNINIDNAQLCENDIFDCFQKNDFKLSFNIENTKISFDLGKDFSKILNEKELYDCDEEHRNCYLIYPTTYDDYFWHHAALIP